MSLAFVDFVKRSLATSLALSIVLYPVAAKGLPNDAKVVSGSVTIKQPNTNTLNINQATDKAIINWQGFNINVNELVKFNQPNSSSVALNRVIGADPSKILGQLGANGRVFIVNPNGIFFGPSSSVDVAGLFATTLGIKDTDFLAGKYQFNQDPTKSPSFVINQGQLKVSDDGFVFLVAPGVKNENLIIANLGKVVLASGQQFTVDFMGDGLINFAVDGKVIDKVLGPDGHALSSAVSNSGTIKADGGQVVLAARASKDIFSSVVNNSGIIEAKSLVNRGGVIRLEGSDPVENTGEIGWQANLDKVQNAEGSVINSGTLDISAAEPGAAQGQVTLSGELVGVSGTILALGADGAQGGRVLITTTAQTELIASSLIDTSGVGNSSAGNVVVWSDNDTIFRGFIAGRGGELGGDGANVEVSGYSNLTVSGLVDLRAGKGLTGTLLLDPGTVTIFHACEAEFCDPVDEDGPNRFSDAYIEAQLDESGLFITTSDATDGPTDIIFEDNNIQIQWTGPNTLTFDAGRNIDLKGSISGPDGQLVFRFGQGGDGGVLNLNDATVSDFLYLGGAGFDTVNASNQSVPFNTSISLWSVERLIGNGGSLEVSSNTDNTWTIAITTGEETVTSNLGTVSFTGFSSLSGGPGNDIFMFDGGTFTGNIDGGSGFNTLNYSVLSGPISVNLQNLTASGIDGKFSNINNFVGSASPADILTASDTTNTWNLSGGFGSVNSFGFSTIENLIGGIGNDTFTVGSSGWSGSIDGGGGTGINTLISGGNASPAIWTITGTNSGTVNLITGGFSNIQNLVGDNFDQDFVFTGSGNVTGNIQAGSGTNTLNYSAVDGPITVNLETRKASRIGGTISNINNLIGSGGSDDTLTGANTANAWTINTVDGGNLNDIFTFSNMENLVGGTNTDSFTLAGGTLTGLTGSINGGDGTNTLTADNVANTWTITGANSGTVTGVNGDFTNIANLVGGTNSNNFVFSNGSSVSGRIEGSGGNDTLDWSAYATARSVTLSDTGSIDGFKGGEVSISGGFDNINDIRGSGGAGDTLTAIGTTLTVTPTQISEGNFTINYSQFETVNVTTTEGTTIGGSFESDLIFTTPGALIFETTMVKGDLEATSGGSVTQTGPLNVTGTTTIDASTNTITLNNPFNDFEGTVNLQGSNIGLTDANTLTIGVFKSHGGGASIVSGGSMIAGLVDQNLFGESNESNANLQLLGNSSLRAGGDIGTQNAPLVVSLGSQFDSISARIAHFFSGPPNFLTADEIGSVDALALFLNGQIVGGRSFDVSSTALTRDRLVSIIPEMLVLEEASRVQIEEELKRRLQISESIDDMPLAVAAVTLNFRASVQMVSFFEVPLLSEIH